MAAGSFAGTDFRVGDWLVQPRLARIHRGQSVVHVTPRAMAVLVCLAEAGGRVVSRNELLDTVWPRMTVTQDALAQCLVELRKAFDDDAKKPAVIETIPRIGVRLIPVVSPVDPPVFATARHASPSRTAAYPSRKRAATVVAVAVAVGAAAFWLGRAPAPLIGAPTEDALSAELATTSVEAREFYLSASDYAQRTDRVNALPSAEILYRRAIDADPDFALAYARLGQTNTSIYWYGIDRTPARLAMAEQAILRALALAPDLAVAHVALGDYRYKGDGDYAAALEEFATAERLGSVDPELYFSRAFVYRRLGQWDSALANFTRALDVAPRNVVYLRQQHITHLFLRDYASAEQSLERILGIVPDDGTTFVDAVVLEMCRDGGTELARRYAESSPSVGYAAGLAHTYTSWLAAIYDRDYERARAVLRDAPEERVFDGDLRPTYTPKELLYARTARLAGRTSQARAHYETVAASLVEDLARGTSSDVATGAALRLALAESHAALGLRESAIETMREARALIDKDDDALLGSAVQLATIVRVLLTLGDRDGVLEELDDYLAGPGHWSIEGLRRDPRLDLLRDDERFAALTRRYRP